MREFLVTSMLTIFYLYEALYQFLGVMVSTN